LQNESENIAEREQPF